jgi:hypothetical protein
MSRAASLRDAVEAKPSGAKNNVGGVPSTTTMTKTATTTTVAAVDDIPDTLNHPDVGSPPDGGLEAWLCILGGMLQMFCVFGFCELDINDLQADTSDE